MAAKWPKIVRSTALSRLLGGGFDHRANEMPILRTGTNNAVQKVSDSSQRPAADSDGILMRCRWTTSIAIGISSVEARMTQARP